MQIATSTLAPEVQDGHLWLMGTSLVWKDRLGGKCATVAGLEFWIAMAPWAPSPCTLYADRDAFEQRVCGDEFDTLEAAQREAECRVRAAYDALAEHCAPVLIWESGPRARYTATYQGWILRAAEHGWALARINEDGVPIRLVGSTHGWSGTVEQAQQLAVDALRGCGVRVR